MIEYKLNKDFIKERDKKIIKKSFTLSLNKNNVEFIKSKINVSLSFLINDYLNKIAKELGGK